MIHYLLKIYLIIIAMLISLKTNAFVGEKMIDGINYYIVTKGKTATVIGYETLPQKGVEYVDIVIPSTIECEGVVCDVVEIASEAFAYDGYNNGYIHISGSFIKSVTIGSRVKKIGARAFYYCQKLTDVTLTNTDVLYIGKEAFSNCFYMDAVHISNLEDWMKIQFEDGSSNPLNHQRGLGKGELFLNGKVVKDLIIPNGVTSIGSYAFLQCESLESITIPNTVTSIGQSAFGGCMHVKKIVLPNSITSIGQMYIDDSPALNVYISDLESFCNIEGNITARSWYLYLNGKEVKELIIPNNIGKIGDCKFEDMDGLTKVTIPHNIVSIGAKAFSNNDELLSAVINCQYVGNYNFLKCPKLKTVTIGECCKKIGYGSISSCPELTDVFCFAKEPPTCDRESYWNSWVFKDCEIQYATLHVPAASISKYENTEPWNSFGTIVALTPEETTSIERIESMKETVTPIGNFSLEGISHRALQKGVNIIRYSNGSTQKVFVK